MNIECYAEFRELSMKKELNMMDKRFNSLINNLHFKQILNSDISEEFINQVEQSQVIVIDTYNDGNIKYFIICFHENIIMVDQSNQEYIKNLFSDQHNSKIFIFNESKADFLRITNLQDDQIQKSSKLELDILEEEISNFKETFYLTNVYKPSIKKVWKQIQHCVCGYLIKKSYLNVKNTSILDIERSNSIEKIFDEKEFVLLRIIEISSECIVNLAYHFKTEQLFCIKKSKSLEGQKNIEREINNYKKLYNPFICQFYGTIIHEGQKSLVIEFINGENINSIKDELKNYQKIMYAYQIVLAIDYLHSIHYIYRDLKPDNVIIKKDKFNIVLIDFDQMIDSDKIDEISTDNFSRDFSTIFAAPEICGGNNLLSYKTDIYSIGMMIYYIFMKDPKSKTLCLKGFEEKYPIFYQMYLKCTNKDQEKRPTIIELNRSFDFLFSQSSDKLISEDIEIYKNFKFKMLNWITNNTIFTLNSRAIYFNDFSAQNALGKIFYEGKFAPKDINKSIHFTLLASNNNPDALYNLGALYIEVKKDINKGLNYLNLAAEKNSTIAQFNLGLFNLFGRYIPQNTEKAIYYFELAARKNNTDALNNLGNIYLMKNDIEKAINYYTLAADLKDSNACYNLGLIYSDIKYQKYDIDKAIYYYKFAADNDIVEAMHDLGCIYSDKQYNKQDIDKAIYYLTKSANENDIRSFYELGNIYFQGELISINIDKAIKYFKIAADQDEPNSQFNLGLIYSTNRYIHCDAKKSIHYLSLAANKNHSEAQFHLGNIYYLGIIVPKNIEKALNFMYLSADKNNNPKAQYFLCRYYASGVDILPDYKKAIHYLTLASNQNFSMAQYDLGFLYYEAKHVKRDMKKAIHLMTLAANQNYALAQYDLGCIYLEGKYINRDVNKAIDYFIKASKQNHMKALINLGIIFSDGLYTKIDIIKAIHYFSIAANQNNPKAQFYLGTIYYFPEYGVFDIDKAIQYLNLASEQNYIQAQNLLGIIYLEGKYVQRDIPKGINYLTISADKGCVLSQRNLGFFYSDEKNNEFNIQKAIHYFTLAAKNNISEAQGALAIIYYKGKYVQKNIEKALQYLHLSASNHYHLSERILGDLYLEGKHVNRDVSKAIHYYIEALIIKDEYAKNNLAIIYKNGFGNIKINLNLAQLYLEEVIKEKKCIISMFNLSKIYYFEEEENGIKDHNRSLKLLIDSIVLKLHLSVIFLFLLLLKRFKLINSIILEKELKKINVENQELVDSLYKEYLILSPILLNTSIFEEAFEFIRSNDLIFLDGKVYFTSILHISENKQTSCDVQQLFNIDDDFYEGLGNDISYEGFQYK